MEQVRPFLILGDSHRARVADRVGQCLRQWSDRWLARGTVVPVVVQIDNCSASRWIVAQAGPLHAVGIGFMQAWIDSAPGLFAGPNVRDTKGGSETDIVRQICESALESLATILCDNPDSRLIAAENGPAESVAESGSGFIAFECRFEGGGEIQIVGWPEWVSSLRGANASNGQKLLPLVSPLRALDCESVRIDAIVGEAELPLGEFAGLAVGDVLVLECLLDQPLSVRIDGGDIFAGGHLCAASGKKAVELLPLDS